MISGDGVDMLRYKPGRERYGSCMVGSNRPRLPSYVKRFQKVSQEKNEVVVEGSGGYDIESSYSNYIEKIWSRNRRTESSKCSDTLRLPPLFQLSPHERRGIPGMFIVGGCVDCHGGLVGQDANFRKTSRQLAQAHFLMRNFRQPG